MFRPHTEMFTERCTDNGDSQVHLYAMLSADGNVKLHITTFGPGNSSTITIPSDQETSWRLRQLADAVDRCFESKSEQEWEHACQREEAVELMPQIPGEVA